METINIFQNFHSLSCILSNKSFIFIVDIISILCLESTNAVENAFENEGKQTRTQEGSVKYKEGTYLS